MKIDKSTLENTAHLARLEFKEEDAQEMMDDMTKIITWVEQLEEVDTEGVEPLTTMSHEVNALREDENKPHMDHDSALKNGPKTDSDYFRVPKVLE
ncbi:MAG: Asp-tRNA(Asn)/Glu-tRNA(Gln) amidotransferase subunit GatC [Cyclobacteriaceae bacterium]|nr:Asp-tRNA(Asn)/Glu-tRNA(Gln) amidotransferase subunit GatC [Cyclobacteriaceae bacterium]